MREAALACQCDTMGLVLVGDTSLQAIAENAYPTAYLHVDTVLLLVSLKFLTLWCQSLKDYNIETDCDQHHDIYGGFQVSI